MDLKLKLLKAVQDEDAAEVSALLKLGANPDSYYQLDDGFDGTLLHYTKSGNVATELLKYGANVDSRDWYGSTPLLRAVKRGCFEIVKLLLDYGASIMIIDGLGELAITHAIRFYNGDMSIIRELIKYGASVKGVFFNSTPPLHTAVFYNRPDVIGELFKHGADLEERNYLKLSALHLALQNNSVQLPTIKKLLEVGADSNQEYLNNLYPIDLAILHKDVHVVRELLKYGAKVRFDDEYFCTPLFKALINCDPVNCAIIHELLKYGAKAGSYLPSMNNNSPTAFAADKHFDSVTVPDWVKLLIKYSTIDYFELYELYSSFQLKIILKNLADYAIQCIFELSLIREEIVDDAISLYDYLKKYVNKEISVNDISKQVASKIFYTLINTKFPIYEDIICYLVKRDYSLQIINQEAIFTFTQKSRKIILNSDTVHCIASYLSDTDVLNLAIAYNKSYNR